MDSNYCSSNTITSAESRNNNSNEGLQSNNTEDSSKPPSILYSKRLFVTLLLILGSINLYALRANLSIAIVEMTSATTIQKGNQTIFLPAEYNWDSRTIGTAMSIYYYGVISSLLISNISIIFGGSTTLGVATLLDGLLAISIPFLLQLHFYLFLAGRVLGGLLENVIYASSIEVISRWSAIKERSTLTAYIFSGTYIGGAITYSYCGYIAFNWGWRMVFYITGVVNCVTALLYLIFVKNHPSEDKRISKKELNYLLQETENASPKETALPWKQILTSACFWALCTDKFVVNWGTNIVMTSFPQYVKDVTQSNIDQVGLISTIPNIISTFVTLFIGKLVDYCQNNSDFKSTTIHKFIIIPSLLFASLLFMAVGFITNFFFCMVCFVVMNVFLSVVYVCGQLVILSMAPKNSSVIATLSAVWYGVSSIVTPNLIGFVVVNHSAEEWRTCFIISSIVIAVGAFIFLAYGSSEPQIWPSSTRNSLKRVKQDL